MIVKLSVILLVAVAVSATHEPVRRVRSLQPGAPDVNNKDQPWQLDPYIGRDDKGNTKTDVNIKRHGEDHDFDAGWSKVVSGPNKAKPTWHVGGTYRWRRSLQPGAPDVNNKDQPWQLDPYIGRDDKGNTKTDVNIKRHGEDHDFDAGWSKVVSGPNKAKPTWHVGGTYRWRRSLQPGAPDVNNKDQPWQLDPYIGRDDKGNTRTDVNIKRHGEDHDFDAGWSKVVSGPNKAKPTWHVGGTYRWRRSLQPGAPEVNNKDQPWQLDPYIGRDNKGNTKTDVNIKRHGEDHDFDAGWSKVVSGPNKAKPTWHVGGTYRWRRSLQPGAPDVNNKDQPWQLDPYIARDDKGNTKTDVNIKRHGEDHDFDARWSKVVSGPNKAKPTWHVRGTYRWRRSLQPGAPHVNNKDQPWQLDPYIGRDDKGNTKTDVNIKRHGEDHDFDAGWSKVVSGPNKAKPTWHVGGTYRWRRSLQPGAPDVNNKDQPWQLDPYIGRDDKGNTKTDVNIKRHGEDHDFDAGWSKVVSGPNKAKPTWHVGGTYRWRRSLQPGAPDVNNKDQPWQLDPYIGRDDKGNTKTDVNIKRHGEDHDFDAGWSKVVSGPNKAKPTWHVGGTYRWRRSLQPGAPDVNNKDQPWQLDPYIGRDDKGNTKTDVNIKRHGEDHDFDAGWSKVVSGPNKAKPTWHVGGTYRWRRSLQPGAPHVNNKDQPWQLDPYIGRDDKGNTKTDVNIKRHGEDHDFDAGWSKVVSGPNKAKPTWHVGGTYRWRRSLQPGAPDVNNKDQPWQLDPYIGRDDKGNTKTDVNIKRHGEDHDFDAGWSKVVSGPNKAKPTWHVGGTYRWRRSLQPGAPDVNNKDQPWQLDPYIGRDDKGNTKTDVNIKRHGEDHDFDAGWSKVVSGPNKAKPTWHVGGTYRWRRSLQPGAPELSSAEENEEDEDERPWQFNPQLGRDADDNTKADINLKRHGENHDIEASWSKVVDGPDRAKPVWHVGGTFKW